MVRCALESGPAAPGLDRLRCAETRHKPGDNRCAALDLQWLAGVTASASASRPRRLSQAHPITETRRNSQPTCLTAFCSSPIGRPDLQSQAKTGHLLEEGG